MGVINSAWCEAVNKIDALIEGGKSTFNIFEIECIAALCGVPRQEANNLANYSAQALRGVYG